MGDDLWPEFVQRLRASGTEVSDIMGCSSTVFHAVLSELGFSALHSARLQTEWSRRTRGAVDPGPSGLLMDRDADTSGSLVPCSGFGASTAQRTAVNENSNEFKEIATEASAYLSKFTIENNPVAVNILSLERVSNPTLEWCVAERRRKLCNPQMPPIRTFALVPISEIDAACSEGLAASHILTGGEPHFALSEGCGMVFVVDPAPTTAALASGSVANTKLLVCDAYFGNVKLLLDREAAQLCSSLGSREGILASLKAEGYDSVACRSGATGSREEAYGVFHPHQVVPRYCVTFTMPSSEAQGPSRSASLRDPEGTSASSSSSAFCPKHPKKVLEFWCPEEKKLLCSHCMYLDGYKNKSCILAEEAANAESAWVASWLRNAELFVKDTSTVTVAFDAAIDHVDQTFTRETYRLKDEAKRIKDAVDEIVALAEKRLVVEVNEHVDALQSSMARVVEVSAEVEERIVTTRRALASQDPLAILQARQKAGAPLPVVRIPELREPKMSFGGDPLRAMEEQLVVRLEASTAVQLPQIVDGNQISEK